LMDASARGGFAGLELLERRDDGGAENVDKTLSGIEAVQTLSRLNRAHPQKHDSKPKPASSLPAQQLAILYLPYQRPWPYQPPPPSSRKRTTMMRRVVVLICGLL
jgi:hypothetical protein